MTEVTEVTEVTPVYTQAERDAVEEMAAPIIREHLGNKKFLGKRNRKNWLRMNRPEKVEAMEQGVKKMYNLLERFKVTKGTKVTEEV